MTIWRILIASWIPKATNTHSEYVIFIAFPLQQWLAKHTSMFYIYIYKTLRCTYIYQHFISTKSEFNISISDVGLQAVITCFQIFKNNLLTHNKSCNVPFICLLEINVSLITASSETITYCHICLTSDVMHRTNSYER
jgi:hypothetical protein